MKFGEYCIIYGCTNVKCSYTSFSSAYGREYSPKDVANMIFAMGACPYCHVGKVSVAKIVLTPILKLLKKSKQQEQNGYECWKYEMFCNKCNQSWETEVTEQKSKVSILDPELSCPICDNVENNIVVSVHKMW